MHIIFVSHARRTSTKPKHTALRQWGLAAACLISSYTGNTQALTITASDFEAPAYTSGAIDGQNGWAGDGVIQSTTAATGSQALQIDASSALLTQAFQVLSTPVSNTRLTLEMDFLRRGISDTQAGIAFFSDTGFLVQVATLFNDRVVMQSDAGMSLAPVATLDVWHHLRIDLDFFTLTATGFVDGVALGSLAMAPVGGTPTSLTFLQLYTFDSIDPLSVFFDNVTLRSNVPNPTGIALVGLGLIGLVRGCRAKT